MNRTVDDETTRRGMYLLGQRDIPKSKNTPKRDRLHERRRTRVSPPLVDATATLGHAPRPRKRSR